MVGIMEERAPYVDFMTDAVEDRNATIEAGHYVGKDVDYALITPMGSKDTLKREVQAWFTHLEDQVKEGRFPREWMRAYKEAYNEYKQGNEIPITGTPVKTCPIFSPAQVKYLIELNVRTLEDLAVANEETLGRIGMGSHDLKQKAIAFLEAAQDKGKLASKVAALEVEKSDAQDTIKRQGEAIAALEARLSAIESKQPKKL